MKKYDFETPLDRRGHDALAVDAIGMGGFAPDKAKEGFDTIPGQASSLWLLFAQR